MTQSQPGVTADILSRLAAEEFNSTFFFFFLLSMHAFAFIVLQCLGQENTFKGT